jgi:hypothetical protein
MTNAPADAAGAFVALVLVFSVYANDDPAGERSSTNIMVPGRTK